MCFDVKGQAFTQQRSHSEFRYLVKLVEALHTTFQTGRRLPQMASRWGTIRVRVAVQLEGPPSRYTAPTTLTETRSRILVPKDCQCGFYA